MQLFSMQQRQRRWFVMWFAIVLGVAPVGGKMAYAEPISGNGQATVAAIQLEVEQFATGFDLPVKIASAGDDRLFVVEQEGLIHVVTAAGDKLTPPFLDLRNKVGAEANEQGLLGLVFEPEDATIFYVNYTDKIGDTVIARYRTLDNDANRGDPNSEQVILMLDQPAGNHNGGDMAFGPNDGFLYIPTGDGGGSGDAFGNAQNLSRLLGKVLRIQVTGEATYAIPADNPYANDGNDNTRPEIWSRGWRNPWRFSFDRANGDLYIADVGQRRWEEVNFIPAGMGGGGNYGWNRCEGTYVYPAQDPPQKCSTNDDLTEPVFEYPHSKGCSVTGGYVYRGTQSLNMVGHYLFADFCSGIFWSMVRDAGEQWVVTEHGELGVTAPSSFGEAADGELYVADRAGGVIYHIVEVSTPPTLAPQAYLPVFYAGE